MLSYKIDFNHFSQLWRPDRRNYAIVRSSKCRSVNGFLFGGCLKIACAHRKGKSSLILHYIVEHACDAKKLASSNLYVFEFRIFAVCRINKVVQCLHRCCVVRRVLLSEHVAIPPRHACCINI